MNDQVTNRLKTRRDRSHDDWSEIEAFIAGVTELSERPQTLADFASNAIERTVELLEAAGGCIWLANQHGELNSVGISIGDQVHASLLSPQEQSHREFLEQTIRRGEVATAKVPAHVSESASSTVDLLWIAAPCRVDDQTSAIIEVLQTDPLGPDAKLGHERLLAVVGQLTESFVQRSHARLQNETNLIQQQREAFLREIHRSIDLNETAYRIVNEGRLLIGCDRLSLAVCQGKRFRLAAISGIDVVDAKSPLVTTMRQLLTDVGRSRHWLRYRATSDNLPPQIQTSIERYINQSNTDAFDAIPLLENQPDSDQSSHQPSCIGVLLVEHLRGEHIPGLDKRIESVASLSIPALSNSLGVASIPFLGVGKCFRRSIDRLDGSRHRVVAATVIAIGICVAFALVPTTYFVRCDGEAIPRQQRHVFAPLDGEVVRMHFDGNHEVQQGQPLIELRNRSLELELQRLQGDYRATEKKRLAVTSARIQQSKTTDGRRQERPGYAVELAAEEQELSQQLQSLEVQIDLLKKQMQQLVVASPITGQLLTWDPTALLTDRPVARGQRLLTVANLQSEWVTELKIPERKFGHLYEAFQQQRALTVRCTTSDGSAKTFEGKLTEVSRRADIDSAGHVHSLGRVEVPEDAAQSLRPGIRLHCKVDCGQRSMGFVWFHSIYETIRSWIAW